MNRTARSQVPGALLLASLLISSALPAAEWPQWRGPFHDGTSPETGLVSEWSKEGENLAWRVDFTGRSTPVVFDGKVCANGRVGEDQTRQGMVACFDAGTGRLLWEHRYPVYHTTVPWNRVGWANVAGDPESGLLFAQAVHGMFWAFDVDTGEIAWSHFLPEEYGFLSGYGGRTQTPLVHGDRVYVTFASSGWGNQAAPRHRVYAFDKASGVLVWVATPGGMPADMNSQSTPQILVVEGRELIVHGNGDGHVYAQDAATGEKVWDYHLSKRGINSTVLVDGTTVYAAHSEENPDTPDQARVVAIDGTGTGDVTKTHERWRRQLGVGFGSPALSDGTLYVLDNAANLHALDAATGEPRWQIELGTVGKSSPVVADGKLYVTEVNGRFHILKVPTGEETAPTPLDQDELEMPEGRYAEIYGSPAVAYGRVYFTTEEGLYALGDPDDEFTVTPGPSRQPETAPGPAGQVARILVVPAEALVHPGDAVEVEVLAFDAKGRPVPWARAQPAMQWQREGLTGELMAEPGGGEARFETSAQAPYQAGTLTAELGGMSAATRIRVIPRVPFTEDFESYAAGSAPPHWIGAAGKWAVIETESGPDGPGKVLEKGPRERGLERHATYIGAPDAAGYTIQADVKSTKVGRRMGDVGLINSGYTVDLRGSLQTVELRSWEAARRISQSVPFAWEPDTWYTVKFDVDSSGAEGVIRAKVWPAGAPEPEAWTITARDPVPVRQGSPGIQGYSPTSLFYDNLKVTAHGR